MFAAFGGMVLSLCGAQLPLAMPFKEDPPIMVDGDLSDWAVVPGGVKLDKASQLVKADGLVHANWKGAADLSAEVKVAYRDYAMFISAKVTDDKFIQRHSGGELWKGDHLEIFLDFIPGIKSKSPAFAGGQFIVMLSPGNFKDIKPEVRCFFPEKNVFSDIKVEAVKTAEGYNIEAEIPWKNFKNKPSMGKVIDLEVWVSDTDNPEASFPQESILCIGNPARKVRERGLRQTVLTTADGVIKAMKLDSFPAIPVKVDTAGMAPQKIQNITFELPEFPEGVHPILKIQANILIKGAKDLRGWASSLLIKVNGKELNQENIVERPIFWSTRDGIEYKIYGNHGFIVPFTGDFKAGNMHRYTNPYLRKHVNLHDFALDLTGIAKSGSNTLVLQNGVPYNSKVKRILELKNCRIEFAAGEMRRPRRPAPTGKLEVIKPAKDFKNAVTVASAGNPLKLVNGKNQWLINSSFSTPDGKWNTGSNKFFDYKRSVKNVPGGILVSDTFTNLTGEVLPVIQKHIVPFAAKGNYYISGLDAKPGSAAKNMFNGSVFGFIPGKGGIGMVPMNRVLQIHAKAQINKDNSLQLFDDQFALPPKKSITQEFFIVTVENGDYWNFINVVRNSLKMNHRLDGPLGYLHMNWGPWPDSRLVKRIKDGSIKTIFMDTHAVKDPQIIRDGIARLRKLVPHVKVLCYYHAQLNGLYLRTESVRKAVGDDLIAKADADQVLLKSGKGATYYHFGSKIHYTTLDNNYGKVKEKVIDEILNNWDVDGIFWDEFSSSGTAWHYGEPWDGCSADIDPDTFKLITKKSSVYMIQYEWKNKMVNKILDRKKFIFSGVPRDFLDRITHGHCETAQISNCATQLMRSPMQMADYTNHKISWVDYYRAMCKGLDYGVLFNWAHISLPSTRYNMYPTLTEYMFPTTPIEFRSGYIIGKERIVTNRSGRYGWDDNSRHEVHVYDEEGKKVAKHNMKTVTVSGKTWTDLRLAEDWSAVIVRK